MVADRERERDPGAGPGAEPTLLVGLALPTIARATVDEHLDELERLVETAGGAVLGRFVQERQAPDAATVVGSGFLSEVAEACREHEVRLLVFDDDLTGSQVRNVERVVPEEVKVLDRAAVILDIFALRARSREAKTQVELAQLSYLLPRLTRRWGHLSRQAGGIGTRGVGETQLEIDRRLINRRIAALKRKLATIERDRRLRRDRRRDQATVALVGYTNAGKSSLFKRLTSQDVLVEDRLFATLDPRSRRVGLGDEVIAVLTDTVGFIRKLPHDLVAPFRSTLEEASESDLLLHVVDVSHPQWREHLQIGSVVLDGLGVDRARVLVVLNKIDLVPSRGPLVRPGELPDAVPVSAVTGAGAERLRSALRTRLISQNGVEMVRVPLEEAGLVERALGLPHRVARRFDGDSLAIAARVDSASLVDAGLGAYRLEGWDA